MNYVFHALISLSKFGILVDMYTKTRVSFFSTGQRGKLFPVYSPLQIFGTGDFSKFSFSQCQKFAELNCMLPDWGK